MPTAGSKSKPKAPPLSLAALDAAISEHLGKPVRRDRLARDDRVFRWIIRRASTEGDRLMTTYAEAAKGAGYDVDPLTSRAARKRARQRRVSTINRALSSLEGAGLIEFNGVVKENGQWRCLTIRVRPSARGMPQAGRSQRHPTRCPGSRVRFSPQSGTSPAVAPAHPSRREGVQLQTADKREPTGARAGAGGSTAAPRTKVRRARAGSWPLSAFELRDQELVEICEAFEGAFPGEDHNLSFSDPGHAPKLRAILARFDRYFSKNGPKCGAGAEQARHLIATLGAEAAEERRWGRPAIEPHSVAYFIPLLDQMSKGWRRHVKPWVKAQRAEARATGDPVIAGGW